MELKFDSTIKALEKHKKLTDAGNPYWMARDLMEVLGYDTWENFSKVIAKARVACEESRVQVSDQFLDTTKMVDIGSGAKREIEDWYLSKYACYLVAMNGEPSKPEIATSQTYFAMQTHLQETQEQLTDEERRLLLRDRVKDANKKLSSAAKDAGVRNSMFGVFHDAGYKGLYGGIGLQEIKAKKGIVGKDDFLDCIGRTELAANEFRITQCEEKLKKDGITGEQKAIQTHHDVGKKVRDTIKEISGILPEQLPAEPSIKKLATQKAKELKAAKSES